MPKKERQLKIVFIALFVALLVVPSFAWIVISGIAQNSESIREKYAFTLKENRELAKWPEFNDIGTYAARINSFYDDHVPFRSLIYTANSNWDDFFERPYSQQIEPKLIAFLYQNKDAAGFGSGLMAELPAFEYAVPFGDMAAYNIGDDEETFLSTETHKHTWSVGENTKASYFVYEDIEFVCDECNLTYKTFGKLVDKSYLPMKIINNNTVVGRNDWLFFGGTNLPYYSGTNVLSDAQMNEYIKPMLNLEEKAKSCGKAIAFIVYPDKEQMYAEYFPTYTVVTDYKRMDRLNDYIHANTGLNFSYAKEAMEKYKRYAQLYYRYDTHWTRYGALVGTMEAYKLLGVDAVDVADIDYGVTGTSNRDLISLGGLNDAEYVSDWDYSMYYKTGVVSDIGDISFLASVPHFQVVTSEAEDQRTIVIIGDSYRVSMEEFISRDFATSIYIHRDALGDPACIEAIKSADILLIESVERFESEMVEYCDLIAEYLD